MRNLLLDERADVDPLLLEAMAEIDAMLPGTPWLTTEDRRRLTKGLTTRPPSPGWHWTLDWWNDIKGRL